MKPFACLATALIFSVGASSAHATPIWDLTGTYTTYGYWSGGSSYSSITVNTMDLQTGAFSGTSLNIGWDPSWTFALTGVVTGNTFTFDAINNAHNDWGTETGTINNDGSLSNIIWVDRYGVTAYGWSVAGNATPLAGIPEPSSIVLFTAGLAYMAGMSLRGTKYRRKVELL